MWRGCLNQRGSFDLCPHASLLPSTQHGTPHLYIYAPSKLGPSGGETRDQGAGLSSGASSLREGSRGGDAEKEGEEACDPPIIDSPASLGQAGVGVKRAGGCKARVGGWSQRAKRRIPEPQNLVHWSRPEV